jgi:hypothetical protein
MLTMTAVIVIPSLGTTPARADESQPIIEPATAITVHMQPPLLGITSQGGPLMTDVSVSLRFLHMFEAEAGVNATIGICSDGTSVRLQAGVIPGRSSPLPPGAHWRLRMPWLVGYANFTGSDQTCDPGPEGPTQESAHALSIATGIDATRWSRRGFGFNLRLLLMGGKERRTETWPGDAPTTDWRPYFAGMFTLGLAIGI